MSHLAFCNQRNSNASQVVTAKCSFVTRYLSDEGVYCFGAIDRGNAGCL